MSTEDWRLALSTILLPGLSTFELSAWRIDHADLSSVSTSPDTADILYFIGRHPSIKVLRLCRQMLENPTRLRPASLTGRPKLERSMRLLPHLEELRGSVKFVFDFLQRDSELASPSTVFPKLKHIYMESGFVLKASYRFNLYNIKCLLHLIQDIRTAGGLASVDELGIDCQTYGSSPQLTMLDLMVENLGHMSQSLNSPETRFRFNGIQTHGSGDGPGPLSLSFIRSVTFSAAEWTPKNLLDYDAEESMKEIFRNINLLFPMATDLHFGLLGASGALRWDGLRRAIARMCPSVKRIHSDYSPKNKRIIDLDTYR
ncbi:hypothetical protein H1R20_g4246, partial [Candolleomyces eurysporus]